MHRLVVGVDGRSTLVEMTEEEVAAHAAAFAALEETAPSSVTATQGKLALLQSGRFEEVEGRAFATTETWIWWCSTAVWTLDSPYLARITGEIDLKALFRLAGSLAT